MTMSANILYCETPLACLPSLPCLLQVTYKNLATWHGELRQHRPHIPALLAANKIDENIDVTTKSFGFATKNNMPLYYVSASDGTNVVRLFR